MSGVSPREEHDMAVASTAAVLVIEAPGRIAWNWLGR